MRANALGRLIPEIVPRTPEELLQRHGESIHIRHLGRRERSYWGFLPTLRGVEAIRGLCIAALPIVEVQVLLNGQLIHRAPVAAFPMPTEKEDIHLHKYVFNVWLDFSGFVPGRYDLELRFPDIAGNASDEGRRRVRESVVVGDPPAAGSLPGSDGHVLPGEADDPRPLDEQINARPSVARAARRSALPPMTGNVLVVRTDQLGDVVASIPAMRRLRAILPAARLVGLMTSANAEFAQTLGLFDEIVVVTYPDDAAQRRRVMPLAGQEALREQLAPYAFEMAIDLAPAGESRPLLLLSGAPILVGFGDGAWPWLTLGFDFNSHDPLTRIDFMAHSSKPLALVESLGAMLDSGAATVRRDDLARGRLAAYGIAEGERYAILHTGARIVFSRWRSYRELAAMLLERTGLKVVMLADDEAMRATVPSALMEDDRFQLLDRRLPFDDFDALLSHCAIFVGNDSGPKHLASLRGVPVVSIHTPRIDWREWGQELSGVVMTRKVPCAGCLLYYEPEDCGKGYACIVNITPDEVYAQVAALLAAAAPLDVVAGAG